jgi:PKD repeat protein
MPVQMAFLPSGDILVAEKGTGHHENGISHFRLVKNGVVQETPVLTLSTHTYWDSGLLGFVLDPQFATNGYFYVWYAIGVNATGWTGESLLRLSRFAYDFHTETADPHSELIMLDSTPWMHVHHGNSLIFDDDGYLYIGMGERLERELSQDLTVFNGKVLRIQPTAGGYTIPHDNPLLDMPDVPPELYASGLRNPFRMTKRSVDGMIVIGDVGASTWEEVNMLLPGANYGFPVREGPCPYGQVMAGSISYIYYTGSDNISPTASLAVEPTLGPAPLTVTLSAADSFDPDDVVLTFHWDLGDGTPPFTSTTPIITHTYTTDGIYTAQLQVKDLRGGESNVVAETITVYSGELAQIELTNLTEPDRALYHGGDEILYEAVRSNLDGLDPETPYTWHIDLHHNEHSHPLISNSTVISDLLSISTDNHEGDWNLWLRFYLTMNTDTGMEITVYQEMHPEHVFLTFTTNPREVPVRVNAGEFQTPYTLKSIVGVEHVVEPPLELLYGQGIGVFAYWHWYRDWPLYAVAEAGNLEYERVLTLITPAENRRYIAQYAYDRPALSVWLPLIQSPVNPFD